MEKEFVNYNQALKLKELGFDEPCFGLFSIIEHDDIEIGDFYFGPSYATRATEGRCILAPTFSQAFRWFRKKGYDVKVIKESPGLYFGFYWNGAAWIMVGNGTYEASEQACLDKLIEIVESLARVEHGIYR